MLRRRREDVPGERYRGREQLLVARNISGIERGQRQRCGWSDGIEDSQQSIAVALLVAQNQAVVVEVVAGIHAYTPREADGAS